MPCCVRPRDDGELLVRASAVLKSQGPESWSRGRPGLLWARANSRSARDASCGKIREGGNRWWGGVMWRRRSGVLVVFFFVRKWREGDLSQYKKKAFHSGKSALVREVSPVPQPASVCRLRQAPISSQVGPPIRVQCAQLQLVAALPAPVHAPRTIGVGWVGRERRGRGAAALGSSFVASQGRCLMRTLFHCPPLRPSDPRPS